MNAPRTYEELLARLDGVIERDADHARALCPCHDDHDPSLRVARGDTQPFVLTCDVCGAGFAGVMAALPGTPNGSAPAKGSSKPRGRVVAAYDYVDEQNHELFQVVRLEPKDFRQRHRNPHADPGEYPWVWNIEGVRRVLYRLPEVISAVALQRAGKMPEPIYLVEGEKDADALAALGLVATTNVGGAGKWRDEYTEYLRGALAVCILPDNDKAGREHAEDTARSAAAVVEDVRVLNLPRVAHKGDVSDWIAAGGTREQLLTLAAAAPIWAPSAELEPECESDDWPDIMVPGAATCGPDFPAEHLPELFRGWTETVSESIQVPKALVALLELGLVGAACAKKVVVRISESHTVPVNVWVLVGLDSGERKSATFRETLLPVRDWESRQAESKRGEVAEYQAQVRSLKKALGKAEEAAAKAGGDWRSPEAEEAKRLARDLAELEARPVLMPKFFVGDATPEATQKLIAGHGRLLIASPEGIVFDHMSGRYSQREMSNLDIYLMGYSGDDYDSERVGRDTVTASRPALSMALTTQPEVIAGLGRREGFSGRGILARFWYALPASRVGYRNAGDPRPISPSLRARRDSAIVSLLDIPMPEEPHVLGFDAEALRALFAYAATSETRLRPDGDLCEMKAWGTRVEGGTGRLCGILHMMEHAEAAEPWRRPIAAHTVRAAVAIMEECLIPNAIAAMGAMRADPAAALARSIMEGIKRKGMREPSRRDIGRTVKGKQPKPADLDAALSVLVEWEVLRPLGKRPTGGRPGGPFYAVNPALLADGCEL